MNWWAIGIGAAITAISLINAGIKKYKENLREAAQESAKQAEESANATKSLLELKAQLNDGTKSTDELISAFKEQLKAMGWTETEIDNLITKYGGLAGAIDEATRKALENARTTAHTDVATSSKSLEAEYDGSADIIGQDSTIEGLGRGMSGSGNAELDKQIREILNSKGFMYDPGNNWYRAKDDSAASIYEYYQGLQEIIQLMQQTASETNNSAILDSFLYNDVRDAVDQLSESANLYGDAISRLHNADAQLELADYLKTNSIDSKEAFDNYINGIKNSTEYSDEYKLVLIDVANNAFPQFSNAAKDAGKNANEMTVSLSELEGASDKIKTLGSAFKELSDDGYITTKTLGEIKTATGLADDEWKSYETTLLGAKKGSTEFNQAMSDLTYKVLENQLGTDKLANSDEAYIATVLQENGVLNANAVAHDMVTQAQRKQEIQSILTSGATDENIQKLIENANGCGIAKNAYLELVAKEILFNRNDLDVSDKVDKLNKIAVAAGVAGIEMDKLNSKLSGVWGNDRKSYAESYGIEVVKAGMTTNGKGQQVENWQYKYNGETYEELSDAIGMAEAGKLVDKISFSVNGIKVNYGDNTSSSSSSSSSKNDALDNYLKDAENRYKIHQDETKYINDLQWAQNNLVKSLEEEIDITGKINEAYRDLADNRIKDLEHQIDLTKEFKGENADVTAQYNEIQRVAHEEANRLRSMGYDDNTDEIQDLQKTWWDAENSKLDWRFNDSQDWIDERNRLDDWHLFDDNEVKAWERVIKWLKEEYPHAVDEIKEAEENLFEARENNLNDVLDEVQRHADNVADYYDDINDKLDDRIAKEEALLQIMQGQTDATSKLMDVQNEIDKAIRDSRISLQYLDEKEREGIFNEKDYTKLSKLVKSTQDDIDSLSSQFYNDVIEAYEQDKVYLIDSITAEYERQVAMKERELEIAQAQVDLTKKQIQLNNVLAEKNVKQLVERNGQYVWEWVADTDKVRQATEELMDAEAEVRQQEYEKKQQEAIDEQQRRIDSIKAEQAANDYRVEKMNDYVDDLSKAIENCVDPIKSLEELATQLGDAGGNIVAALQNAINSISGMGVKTSSTSSSSSGGSGGGSWMGSGKNYDTKTDYMSKILGASNKMDVVEYNNARNNKIDGEGMSETKLSSSDAIKIWEKNKHADGTRYTPGGLSLLGEEGFEAFIDKNGHLIPIAQPTIGDIDSGGIVFNTEQMSNLRNLWDLSNVGKVNVDASLVNRTIPRENTGIQNTFTGGIIINAPRDYNDFVRQLTQRIKTKSI